MSLGVNPHPFYEAFWRRVLIVISVAIWFAVEILVSHDDMWAIISGVVLAYSVWAFLIAYPQTDKK